MSDVKLPLLPTRSLARSSCQSLVSLLVGQTLHRHKNKSEIHQGCLPSNPVNCPYVIKVKQLHNQDDLNTFLQEQFFAQYVNEEFHARKNLIGSKLSGITPQIHDVWTCHQKNSLLTGFIVMDQMEGTLQQYVHRYASMLTEKDYAKITLHLLHIFHVLTHLSVLHDNLTLNHLVYRRTPSQTSSSSLLNINEHHPGAIELFIIDWQKVVWFGKEGEGERKKLAERYDRILAGLLSRMEREQAKALKLAHGHTFKVPIRPLSELESFPYSFQPIQPSARLASPVTPIQQSQPQALTTSSFVFSSGSMVPTIPIEIKAPSQQRIPSQPPPLEPETPTGEELERRSPYEYLPPVSPPPEGFDQESL